MFFSRSDYKKYFLLFDNFDKSQITKMVKLLNNRSNYQSDIWVISYDVTYGGQNILRQW
jgi:hypothetical protein